MSEPVHDKDPAQPAASKPVVVKKYANRRLYNTESSSYITLENLAEMVRQGRDFVVYDAKTNEDITRSVLTQIIVEEEAKGGAMLPITFLRQLIGLYGEEVQSLVPRYLEQSMAAFARQQEQVQTTLRQTMAGLPGLPTGLPTGLEDVGRQNMAMMERAMSLFSPFYRPATPATPPATPQAATPQAAAPPAAPHAASADDVAVLRAEIERLRGELAAARDKVVKPAKSRADRT